MSSKVKSKKLKALSTTFGSLKDRKLSTFHFPLSTDSGFTIIEVIVSTTIFAVVITLMLTLFNFTLRIQRKTEALRQVAQVVRNTSEFLVKEIRNGQIDYNIQDGQTLLAPVDGSGTICPPGGSPSVPVVPLSGANAGRTYNPTGTAAIINRIGIVNLDGDRECVSYDSVAQKLVLIRENAGTEDLTPPNVRITMARFYVRPSKDPYTDLPTSPSLVGVQPMVTILLQAQTTLATGEIRSISYQTSVSTNIYNIPNKN